MNKLELIVEGMGCEHCVKAVTNAVQALYPSSKVQISLEEKRVQIENDGELDSFSISSAIENEGYDVVG